MRQHRSPVAAAALAEPLEARTLLAGDHPSLADLPQASFINMVDLLHIESSVGQITGEIGQAGDDDLFYFVAPYSGRTAVTVAQNNVGGLAPAIQLFDEDGVAMAALSDGRNGVAAVPPIPLDTIIEGQTYFVNIRAGTPSDTNEPAVVGAYTVVIVMEIPPLPSQPGPGDNVPFPLPLDHETGFADQFGFIADAEEVDEYSVDALGPGQIQFRVTTPGSDLNPIISVYNSDSQLIAASSGDSETAAVEVLAANPGERYYVRVQSDISGPPGGHSGAYRLDVTGALPGEPDEDPVDNRLTDAEIASARPVGVDLLTGLAQVTDSIIAAGDTDVFTFRALRTGSATVAIENAGPSGDFLGTLGVFSSPQTQVAFDPVGGNGWIARVSFDVVEGQDYYVRVRDRDAVVGEYTLKIVSPLLEYVLMYPEGYSTGTIDEYIPLINPNPYPVSYTITARYEVGERDQVIASGVVPASSRGGITITSQRNPGGSLVRVDTPYAIEIRSDGQLGATLSHYDFGVTTGESFTSTIARAWTFAEARRDPANYRDFLVFYNPNPSAASVRVSLVYDDGDVVTFTRTLDALRRGGVNFTNDTGVTRDGVFSIRVDSDQPIVAALSSYDITNQRGYGLLGEAGGAGQTRGAIPLLAGTPGSRPSIAIFNAGSVESTVTLTTTVLTHPQAVRTVVIGAGQRLSLSSDDLGLSVDALAALQFTATAPVTLTAFEYHTGDGDATSAGAQAASSAIIADAFVNPEGAGTTYLELLSVYNPWETPTQIAVTLLAEGGVLTSLSFNIAARGFTFVRVDQIPAILEHDGPIAFSIRIDGAAPVVASFMHYDLFLDGGWGTLAAPLGLTTALSRL